MVMKNNSFVSIPMSGLESLADSIICQEDKEISEVIEWDAEGWHYQGQNFCGIDTVRRERVALYILALDAINFCFWPSKSNQKESNSLEYDHLAIALRKLAEQDDANTTNESYFFNPSHLSKISWEAMESSLKPYLQDHYLPNIQERCRLWNEFADALTLHFHGSALNLIDHCDGSAPKLVDILVRTFPGFRDEAIWCGRWVAFYKRAQIAVGDWNAALQLDLSDMDQLTTFADYRVPQVLRHWGAIQYCNELSIKVDSGIELTVEEELSIRAATVVCVDELLKVLNKKSAMTPKRTAVTLDWKLWQIGEVMNQQGKMKPHHRVKTIFY
jgi:Potential Queuosine, Q, salvage protein family